MHQFFNMVSKLPLKKPFLHRVIRFVKETTIFQFFEGSQKQGQDDVKD
jgi:hypothetical protein